MPMQATSYIGDNTGQQKLADLPVNVLVVDDDDTDFFVIDRLLKKTTKKKYQLSHVKNIDEAIIELARSDFDAVLIDYYMGERLGTDIFSAAECDLDVPVIVLTGSDNREVEDAALEAGAFDFLDKNAVSTATLTRSLDFAIKRFEVEAKIRENEERLRQACENAEAAHFSKSEFLGFLGTELQTPLNAIIGFSQVMKEQSLEAGVPRTYREYSGTIHTSALHLLNLIDDLLDLSTADTDSFDARQRRFKRYRTWIVDQQEARRGYRESA